jgi:hypothetical protein
MNNNLLLVILVVTLLIATALPALAAGFSYANPVHGGDDLVPPKRPAYGNHPHGCTPPLALNKHGQCALPGDDAPPDPRPHRIGF